MEMSAQWEGLSASATLGIFIYYLQIEHLHCFHAKTFSRRQGRWEEADEQDYVETQRNNFQSEVKAIHSQKRDLASLEGSADNVWKINL